MKKLLAIILMTVSVSSFAQHGFHHHHHGHYRGGYGWIAPTIIGGVIGYEIARNQNPPVVIQQQPVVVQTPYYGNNTTCTPWTEVMNSDGIITRTRTCTQ
jgi:hypothetical protein